MDTIEQQLAEIEQLKAKQALHRQQLAENRQRALEKKNYTKRLVDIGKIVLEILPDASSMSEAEIREILEKILSKCKQYNGCWKSEKGFISSNNGYGQKYI